LARSGPLAALARARAAVAGHPVRCWVHLSLLERLASCRAPPPWAAARLRPRRALSPLALAGARGRAFGAHLTTGCASLGLLALRRSSLGAVRCHFLAAAAHCFGPRRRSRRCERGGGPVRWLRGRCPCASTAPAAESGGRAHRLFRSLGASFVASRRVSGLPLGLGLAAHGAAALRRLASSRSHPSARPARLVAVRPAVQCLLRFWCLVRVWHVAGDMRPGFFAPAAAALPWTRLGATVAVSGAPADHRARGSGDAGWRASDLHLSSVALACAGPARSRAWRGPAGSARTGLRLRPWPARTAPCFGRRGALGMRLLRRPGGWVAAWPAPAFGRHPPRVVLWCHSLLSLPPRRRGRDALTGCSTAHPAGRGFCCADGVGWPDAAPTPRGSATLPGALRTQRGASPLLPMCCACSCPWRADSFRGPRLGSACVLHRHAPRPGARWPRGRRFCPAARRFARSPATCRSAALPVQWRHWAFSRPVVGRLSRCARRPDYAGPTASRAGPAGGPHSSATRARPSLR